MIQHPLSTSLHTICQVLHVTPPQDMPDVAITGISKDTRTIQPGELYLALRGDHFDGHAFAKDALERGAQAVLVDHPCDTIPVSKQIIVPDTLQALQQWAAYERQHAAYTVIAITGSVGKTSTKEMMRSALSGYRVHATAGNYNNHIGMPLTILCAPPDTEYLILEMGMNHAGEIRLLSEIAVPDVAIITHVGAAHLEFFDSVEAIACAKAEVMDGMHANSAIVLPADNDHIALLQKKAEDKSLRAVLSGQSNTAQWRVGKTEITAHGTTAALHDSHGNQTNITLRAIGQHHAINAAMVIACLDAIGIPPEEAAIRIADYHEPGGRGNMDDIPWQDGTISIIDETYNASPAAMQAAMARTAAMAAPQQRRVIAVLGDMRELGTQARDYHEALLSSLYKHDINHLFCIGEQMQYLHQKARNEGMVNSVHINTITALINALRAYIQPSDIILCKASRGEKLEQVIEGLRNTARCSVV